MLPGVHCASSAQPMLAPLLIKTKVPVIYFMLISSFEQTPKQGKYQLCQTLTPSAIRRQQPEKEHQKSRPEANLPSPSFRENSVQRKAKLRPLLPARVLSLSISSVYFIFTASSAEARRLLSGIFQQPSSSQFLCNFLPK